MALAVELLTSGNTPAGDALFIPYSDIDGVANAAELSSATPEELDSKLGFGLLSKIRSGINQFESAFAIASTLGSPNGTAPNIFNQIVSFTFTYAIDLVNEVGSIAPVSPSSTAFVAFDSVFPNGAVLSASDSAPSDGVAIPLSALSTYNSDQILANLLGALSDDRRDTLEALVRWVFDNVPVRSASQVSGVTAKSKNNGAAIAPPANFFQEGDFVQAQANNLFIVNGTYTMTYEFTLNTVTGMYENRVV